MALFKSKKQRDMEAEIKFRRGLAKINRYIGECKKYQDKYWKLGKEALRLGDQKQFKQLASSYLRLRDQVARWQRYLIQMETLGLRRNEVTATGDFLESINALTGSMLRGASPEQVANMQMNIEKAMEKSEALDQTLSIAMEATSDSIFSTENLDESHVLEIAETMKKEALSDEESSLDKEISQSLKKIEDEMRKEIK